MSSERRLHEANVARGLLRKRKVSDDDRRTLSQIVTHLETEVIRLSKELTRDKNHSRKERSTNSAARAGKQERRDRSTLRERAPKEAAA
jgi:hypothetical protein